MLLMDGLSLFGLERRRLGDLLLQGMHGGHGGGPGHRRGQGGGRLCSTLQITLKIAVCYRGVLASLSEQWLQKC